jgi:hypothetical protein
MKVLQWYCSICDGYYKHVMIINDDSSLISKWSLKLIDDSRVIIYDRLRFIIQATALTLTEVVTIVTNSDDYMGSDCA